MKTYESWWSEYKNVFPIVHHVVNAINIFELEDFVKFMSTDFPKWRIEWDWIRWPHWQELSVLPMTVKLDLITKFKNLDLSYVEHELRSNPYKVSIDRLQETPNSSWDTLKDEVMKLSQERNLDFLNMVSTYKKVWDQHSD